LATLPEHEPAGVDEEDGDREEPDDDAYEQDVTHGSGIPRFGRKLEALTQLLR
jgi:hypothetical protein